MALRAVLSLILCLTLSLPLAAQELDAPQRNDTLSGNTELAPAPGGDDPRAATGGAQTLEDILARQRGQEIDETFRSSATGNPDSAASIAEQLGTLGGASDPELWRALRYNSADVTTQVRSPAATVLVQDAGMEWLEFRQGPLATYGGYLLLATLGVLLLFYLFRGRIRIEGEKTGKTILRFAWIERFAHWLLAGSFIVLGLTGLFVLFGRIALIDWIGKENYAPLAAASKWVHNNVSWAFMLGLLMVFVLWVAHNIPNRHDLKWMMKAGGLFSKHSHPPARKFNAGQKGIYWAVIILGASISVSGLSLLFPFELPMFAKTFAILNDTGIPQAVGYGELPVLLAPHTEMQLAQAWHAIIGFVFMAIILAHIYLGSVGMEGAFDAMGKGDVELQWAREHHGLWVEEMEEKNRIPSAPRQATPAE
ncbi:formate dehydrogenase subunit gamma [Tranquillimonas alkanivorans]|uniref:Formate dehydrogenase gamma subunit n=1 Tax=Tranquillimonas alkanivorans TaxID=441119 RepID=A0A1I5KIS3_9RHOB|nr:formate dehydrogenase subunit gamma [Tranquillimonas alkanivorans]SFO84918.1 formate dehydrogenase gamma subunit [Tranquillimonas alkanivorans]